MHELAITESVIKIAEDEATKNSLGSVTAINIVIGELTNIVDDSIQFYFDLIAKGTMAEGAVLGFKRIPAAVLCDQCEERFEPGDEQDYNCPKCGQFAFNIVAGNEFFIESITAV